MNVIKHIRIKNGYSQREFARKSLLSFRGVQLLEKSDHNWRLTTLQKVASSLDLPSAGIEMILYQYLEQNSNSIMISSIRIASDGNASWPLHLFNFVDAFRDTSDESLIQLAPHEALDEKIKALLASTVETLCQDLKINVPEWCKSIPRLKAPWFVAEVESLKPMALVESPIQFRKRDIFVLKNFLNRV